MKHTSEKGFRNSNGPLMVGGPTQWSPATDTLQPSKADRSVWRWMTMWPLLSQNVLFWSDIPGHALMKGEEDSGGGGARGGVQRGGRERSDAKSGCHSKNE